MTSLEEEIAKIQEETANKVEDILQKAENDTKQLKDSIAKLKLKPDYKTPQELANLQARKEDGIVNPPPRRLKPLRSQNSLDLVDVSSMSSSSNFTSRSSRKSSSGRCRDCPICFEQPQRVYSCPKCYNWLCGQCHGKLMNCPQCRTNFALTPSVRNQALERLIVDK